MTAMWIVRWIFPNMTWNYFQNSTFFGNKILLQIKYNLSQTLIAAILCHDCFLTHKFWQTFDVYSNNLNLFLLAWILFIHTEKKNENHNLNYTKKNYDIKWPIFKHYNVFSLRQIHKLNPSVESCHDPPAQIKFPSARSFLKWGINWNNMKNVESQRKKISSEKKNTLPRCKATMRENEWKWSMCTISAVANDRRSHKKRTKNEL